VGQGFSSSPDPLPLSYAVRYASRLSTAGTFHLIRNTMLTHNFHRNPVRERENYFKVIPHLDKQIVGWDYRGLLPFLSAWNHCRFSVDRSDALSVFLQPQL
jgi:hypothetical protein